MRTISFTLCAAVALLFGATATVSAQNGPPKVFDGPLYFSFPLLANYPPLSPAMPYDIMQGYIAFDSLARRGDKNNIAMRLKNLTYSDTARYVAAFLYKLADDDPITFFQWLNTSTSSGMYCSAPGYLRRRLMGVLDTISPKSLNVVPLLASDYILHIHVTDTQSKIDTTAALARSAQLVTAYVIDTIKGKRIPLCKNEPTTALLQFAPCACLNFDYRLEWRRLNHSEVFSSRDSALIDADGNPWIKPGGEYIVFLRFLDLQRDLQYNYGTLIPVIGWGSMVCMYPVVAGKVADPYDDFGFGSDLTAAQFKTALRKNISTLTDP